MKINDIFILKYYENFLKIDEANQILEELNTVEKIYENEYQDITTDNLQHLNNLRVKLKSDEMISWISDETKLKFLKVDNRTIAASSDGIRFLSSNQKTKTHFDYSYKADIDLYRVLVLLVYFGNFEGGDFIIYDSDGRKILYKQKPKHGSAILLSGQLYYPHGVEDVLTGSRITLRQGYLMSEEDMTDNERTIFCDNGIIPQVFAWRAEPYFVGESDD
jgi:hypothetical protein